eukprot:GHUV01051975.1.p1 GENE.GHUV01051975.1~~GHUV01051975.1.p1  ORF type:complete len:132 (+),score=36.32 GHUV01051975.1:1-396(+)
MIGDEVKTMIFAGSDTSSFTMSMLAHHFAAHPQAAERAAAEVHQLLESRGGNVMSLHADDASRLPFLTACVNETLRLAPAGPAVPRTAQQVCSAKCRVCVWGGVNTAIAPQKQQVRTLHAPRWIQSICCAV